MALIDRVRGLGLAEAFRNRSLCFGCYIQSCLRRTWSSDLKRGMVDENIPRLVVVLKSVSEKDGR